MRKVLLILTLLAFAPSVMGCAQIKQWIKDQLEQPQPPPEPPAPPPEPTLPVDALDPSEVTWLDADVGMLPINAQLDSVTISNDHRWIVWDGKRLGPPWYKECGDEHCVDGNMSVIVKQNGQWYGARFEWLLAGQMSYRCRLEWREGDAMFIQSKRHPVNVWKDRPGKQVYFVGSSMVSGGLRPEPRGRTQIFGPVTMP